ncbi:MULTISPECIES: 50S ribosomal protein L6 [Methylocaldum]|jgi:large subunit ribosomal protein L6|uniref:50S ribosomal protein L6 n=1 Tax=unclassified Methylocaldum TaxID=2622260 RepID=UPI00098BCBF5|nr:MULTISPECIES: 50S ribosomal protein L6 [unclassified Methylocaldum]MBP1152939.1 large subunit ribosomal protein L6 [Methylocaldum sp. RMAD-M]MVF22729.1 50S ribosomal protein L6 [Methylocaldum sp. BRCS4]
MSRIAKNPVALPKGVEASISGDVITVKGAKGALTRSLSPKVRVEIADGHISILADKADRQANALAGSTRANIANMVTGVSVGFARKLTMVGVGYRAQAKGDVLSLSLGFSHPLELTAPEGITIETPSQTEIVVKGCDKQRVGQVAADIRAYRPPEPYKGKGVRYAEEEVVRKEAKKK